MAVFSQIFSISANNTSKVYNFKPGFFKISFIIRENKREGERKG